MQELTPKQQKFISEYLVDLNATQAAIRAGYSKKNADKIGSELLGKTRVAEAIKKKREKLEEKTGITQEWVLKELKNQYERANEVAEFNPSLKSLELLGKYLGMFKDKLEHSGGLKITHEDALKELS